MRTLLAISQITTLTLDLVDGGLGVLDVGHEGRRHAARVARDGEAVGGDAGERERGVRRGVGDPRRRGEPQPRGDREEHRGVVDVPDRGEHRDYRQGDVPRPPRHRYGRLPPLLFRPAARGGHSVGAKLGREARGGRAGGGGESCGARRAN